MRRLSPAAVSVDGQLRGTGSGRSKKEAEQHAAEIALDSLEVEMLRKRA